MKPFAKLFKKYRLRAEFDTFTAFGDALSEKGYHYEDSIFSHWQKGARVPSDRRLVVTIINIFMERNAILSKEEANEFLASTNLGYLTKEEESYLPFKQKSIASSSRRISNIWITVLFLTGIVGVLTSFFVSQQKVNYINIPQTVNSAVTEPKKLVIGVDATLKPMEYEDNGSLKGYDIDLGMHLAKELDADIEFRNILFNDLFSALEQRRINMIISSVSIIEERKQKYSFSKPYLNAGQVLIVRRENDTIQTVEDLRGKKIATQTGTTNELEALKHTADKYVIRYRDFEEATISLKNNKVEALFTDLPNAKGIVSENTDLKIVGKPFTKEYYGIVFLRDDPSINQVNEALGSLEHKGVLQKLEMRWLK